VKPEIPPDVVKVLERTPDEIVHDVEDEHLKRGWRRCLGCQTWFKRAAGVDAMPGDRCWDCHYGRTAAPSPSF